MYPWRAYSQNHKAIEHQNIESSITGLAQLIINYDMLAIMISKTTIHKVK